MNYYNCSRSMDCGPDPCTLNVGQMAAENQNFRIAVWTGCHLQMTLMCIPPCGEIGLEIHPDTDQLIRVEHGRAAVRMGRCKNHMDFCQNLCMGDVVFVPAGTWHNVVNTGRNPLRVSSIYAPPNHPRGTVHKTKKEADQEE